MTILKTLLTKNDKVIEKVPFLTEKEIEKRHQDYPDLTPKKFATTENHLAFRQMKFSFQGKSYEIQLNHCNNPLCKNFGLPQEKFNVKNKPSRYKITGTETRKSLHCNPDARDKNDIQPLNCYASLYSNWSVVEEIERLVRFQSVKKVEPEYEFHKASCSLTSSAMDTPKDFYKRGKSTSNSQTYQCKTCKKYTNVLPTKKESTTYHQKKNDVLPQFASLLVNKVPINRACEILDIGKGTYYHKLEWLYRCCLEFLETRETKPLAKKEVDQMWLTTDKLHYVLNNVLKRGQGKSRGKSLEEKQLPTFIVVTADRYSNYVFRSDVAYDWDISLDDIRDDTIQFNEDHLNQFQMKNARFGEYAAAPMPPVKNDTQTQTEYLSERSCFNLRGSYVDGLHVNSTYTAIAHLFLVKSMIQSKKWRFITDADDGLIGAYRKVFKDQIASKDAHQMICMTNKKITRAEAKKEFDREVRNLKSWGKKTGFGHLSLTELSHYYLEIQLKYHKFHNKKISGNEEVYFEHGNNPINHPLPTSDRGMRKVDILTNISHLTDQQIALLVNETSDNAVNSFLQSMRRRLSVIERPILTARGDGKSYIYSNFYPKYAQMAITILRTYYNFCLPITKKGIKKTPAQWLGIADKEYSWNDIIYKR